MNRVTIDELINRMEQVLRQERTREEISDWAHQWMEQYENIDGFDWTASDEVVWSCLQTIVGMDLLETPSEYLHDRSDLESWVMAFKKLKNHH
ncbi:hypothetical protein ACFO4U_04890 [Exiguobacterium profundum]|uniref:hypothetical protein n=1 Tax=Exiguobacterium TaxID=33986 RepID=UPI001BE8F375|nr:MULTISPECIES: hypothetical protein [Exiguobacterium]MCM3281160.1 hypothetical protein [Exiguobacterium sp. MER 193]MCT4797203.1 hypothetical protein [Exiguobacterium profundum]MCV9899460.1 hypothetical protein [Exiguobacterium sp. N5]MDT0191758.1 hypothetical protein [Exiguobacterium sp. BG5(2022)]